MTSGKLRTNLTVATVGLMLSLSSTASADAIDQISAADLFEPIPSWVRHEGAPLPPEAEVSGQIFFDIFVVDQPTRVHAVEAALSFAPSGAESLLSTNGLIIHLDGPDAFTVRTGWSNASFPGGPNSGVVDDGIAPGIDLYRREFALPFGLLPGTYALAVYGFENDFTSTFSNTDPAEFKVFQSSVGDNEGFVWPATDQPYHPPYEYDFDFGNYEIQFVNAAYRLETTIIPTPSVLALGLPSIVLLRRRRPL